MREPARSWRHVSYTSSRRSDRRVRARTGRRRPAKRGLVPESHAVGRRQRVRIGPRRRNRLPDEVLPEPDSLLRAPLEADALGLACHRLLLRGLGRHLLRNADHLRDPGLLRRDEGGDRALRAPPADRDLSASVDVVGTGSGTVTGPGVDCPGDCAQTYLRDADVTLSAKPAAGSVFAGWFGDYSGLSATCDLHMGGGRTASAVFMPAPAPEPAPLTPGGGGSAAKSRCTVLGTAGPDVLIGTRGRDVICGRGGSDTLIGRAGGDVLRGGPGSDLVRAGRGRDTLYARDRRSDQLIGGRGDDRARVDVRKDTRTSIESLF